MYLYVYMYREREREINNKYYCYEISNDISR